MIKKHQKESAELIEQPKKLRGEKLLEDYYGKPINEIGMFNNPGDEIDTGISVGEEKL